MKKTVNKSCYKFRTSQKIYLPFKRFLDILFSLIGILVCGILIWPWVIIVNLIVTKGKPFFAPYRLGRSKKPFRMLKFRSMKTEAPIVPPYEMAFIEQQKYETKFGRFLRKTSIDETLQLFNILVGNMSFVGPRPCAAKDEDILVRNRDSYYPSAFLVKPGLTGFAQVRMKRQHEVTMKSALDSFYVSRFSFLLDALIVLKTFAVAFHRE